jgi:lipopolysaccharide transport system permease protein
MTFIYAVIFGTAFASYYRNSIFDYLLACFVGLAVLNFFATSTALALESVVTNGGLLNKIRLPVSIFPVSIIVASSFQFLVGVLPLIAVITVARSHNPLNVIALIVPTTSLFFVCLGFGLMTSALFVFFRDLPYMYELVISLIWITSPVFYPAALVPAAIRPFMALNPIATIMECFRQIALSGERAAFHLMGTSLITSIAFLVVGIAVFAYLRDDFMDLL